MTEEQREAIATLIDSIIEMAAYNDTPIRLKDPVWRAIKQRGSQALVMARKTGLWMILGDSS